jgi:glycine cleavage system aminomethyltransferase T
MIGRGSSELRHELQISAEQATHVYDRLAMPGQPVGLRQAGLKALASILTEKGNRHDGPDSRRVAGAAEEQRQRLPLSPKRQHLCRRKQRRQHRQTGRRRCVR